jgi:hypothetical protein
MKKIFIILSVACFIVISTNAQIRRDPNYITKDSLPQNDTAKKISRKVILDELGLSKEQRTSIKQIQQSRKAERETIENNDSLSAEEKKYILKEFKKETEKKIEAVLTDEQLAKYKALKKEMHDANKQNKGNAMEDDPGYESDTKQ